MSMLAFAMVIMSQFDLLTNASISSIRFVAETHMRYPFDFFSIVRLLTSKTEFDGGTQESKMMEIPPRMRKRSNSRFNVLSFIFPKRVNFNPNASRAVVGSRNYLS
jgi:hypothetical protein